MIISSDAYTILVIAIVVASILPYLISKFIMKKGDKLGWTWICALLVFPINWYTPAVFDVTDCGIYTKDVLIFPKGDYSLGRHNYIVNNSDQELYLEYVVYGKVAPEDIDENVLIAPNTTYKAPFIHLNHVFEEAPNSIKLKGDGSVRYRLSCDVPNYDDDEEEDYIGEE